MTRAKHTIEIVVDEDDVEELANDFRKLYWNHRIVLHSYRSKTERIPVAHCTYCKVAMFEKTSNNLCKRQNCITLRELSFKNKKNVELDRWKEMMCNKCKEDPETDFCYLNGVLINEDTICEGCRYDTRYPE